MDKKNGEYKTWVEVSKKALLHNFDQFQKIVGNKTKIAAVVKANAYGHGLKQVVNILNKKTNIFAVDNISEALEVKSIRKEATIIVLGYLRKVVMGRAIENDISFVVYDIETLKKIVSLKLPKVAKVHIKIETGLNRQGVDIKDLPKLLSLIKKHQNQIFLEGVYTHFANVEDTLDPSYPEEQLERFKNALKLINKAGFKNIFIHSAATGASLVYPTSHFSLIRLGIGLYGLWPSQETKIALSLKKKNVVLKPVLSWKSIVVQIKNLDTGESVGYGRTWYASRKTRIAIVPVGYSDGLDRKLSNLGRVIINGSFAPIIGRVAMNMIMVDVTDIKNVKVENEVTLIGKNGKNEITVEEIAEKIGTINYEVVARINPLLPRLIV